MSDTLRRDEAFDEPWELDDYDESFDIGPDETVEQPRRRWWRWKHVLLALLALFVALFAWLAITAPLSKSLQPIAPPSITLLSAEGDPIARKGAIIDRPVVVAELPDHVPQAFLAIEDRRFHSHLGIDPRGIARATWANLRAGGLRQGGSTITQQLAKVAFLNHDRTAARKLQEVLIAFWLEAWLSKDQILERYLSNVYFGDNVYGLRAAALHYFNRRPEKLTLAQAAMLAGLVKAPSRLNPAENLKGARERAKLVLNAMVEAGFITQAEADATRPARLDLRPVKSMPSGTYFADWVMPAARDRAGEVYAQSEIETTLESDIQAAAVRAVRRAGLGKAQVAIVAMRPDGRVVAMIGGKDYKKSAFNRATQARRQPGSTFKLFVYLAALRAGMTPDSIIEDEPITIAGWSPKNDNGRYKGPITLRQAFAWSSNVAAVRLSERVGRARVIRAARDLGVTTPLPDDDASLALGTSGMSLLELTAAYAAVADGRFPVRARGLPDGERGWLDTVWSRPSRMDRDVREMMLELLSAAANRGTGQAAVLSVPTFGKTGTSQEYRDALFVGFAGDLVAGVWIGNDDDSPTGIGGNGLPARIWRDFMSDALNTAPRRAARAPEPAEEEELDTSIETEIGGVELGVELGEDSVTITADPGNDLPPIPPIVIDREALPPPEDEPIESRR